MALTATVQPNSGLNLKAAFIKPFSAIFAGLMAMTEANAQYRAVQFLSSLSDAELAKRGLKREDISRHVLGGAYYL